MYFGEEQMTMWVHVSFGLLLTSVSSHGSFFFVIEFKNCINTQTELILKIDFVCGAEVTSHMSTCVNPF